MPSSRGSSQLGDPICAFYVSYIGRQKPTWKPKGHGESESEVAQSCPTLCNPMNCGTPGLPIHHNSRTLHKPMSIELVMLSNQFILCHPLLLLPSIFPSIRVFSKVSAVRTRWPKYWSFSFSISPSKEYSELISFRVDWFDFLSVQGTLKSLLQHHQFFSTQPSLWSNSDICT